MEFKGTKEPWEIYGRSSDHHEFYANGFPLFDVISFTSDEETKYNVQLISQAHEMLQMLTQTYLHIDALSKRIQDETYKNGLKGRAESIKKLIKEATEI